MCDTCGCQGINGEHTHHKNKEVHSVELDILGENNQLAMFNRGWLQAKNIFAINMVSSPGSGKTSILEATISRLKGKCNITVIEGDQQTNCDADRINKLGINAFQINTQNGCHLDAHMVIHALEHLSPENDSILFIENVGNLVCPAMFDLGENMRVVVISVTEGDDKPLKYPYMFAESNVCIINKIDLLPYVPCDIYTLKENCLKTNPHLTIFEISTTTGEGMDVWCDFLLKNMKREHNDEIHDDNLFFNKMASTWDSRCAHDYNKIEHLLSKMNIKRGDNILDVGTGTGILIPFLVAATGQEGSVLAVDMSPAMIEQAKKKFGLLRNVSFAVSDVENVQPGGTFDHIVLYSVYPHLKRPIDTIASFIKHHLAPGGNLLIAHSQSKEEINMHHHHIEDNIESLELPAVEELINAFERRGIKVIDAIDNSDYYYILLSNKSE